MPNSAVSGVANRTVAISWSWTANAAWPAEVLSGAEVSLPWITQGAAEVLLPAVARSAGTTDANDASAD